MNTSDMQNALEQKRYETARRLSIAALKDDDTPFDVNILLHEACRKLGDYRTCLESLKSINAETQAQKFEVSRLLAENYHQLATETYYRDSAESQAGLCIDEYIEKYTKLALGSLDAVAKFSSTDEQAEILETMRAKFSKNQHVHVHSELVFPELPETGTGKITGCISLDDSKPAVGVKVVLGLEVPVIESDPAKYLEHSMGYGPHIGEQRSMETLTDSTGCYSFENIPAGRHEFLAVSFNEDDYAIHTRFFAHDIIVDDTSDIVIDWTVADWHSTKPVAMTSVFADTQNIASTTARKIHEETMSNPFHFDFPRQIVRVPLPSGIPADPSRLALFCSDNPAKSIDFQINGAEVIFFAELPALTAHKSYALYLCESAHGHAQNEFTWITEDGAVAIVDTGRAQFRIPFGQGTDAVAPLQAVKGADNVWRGRGRWVLPEGLTIEEWSSSCLYQGNLECCVEICYQLSDGQSYGWTLTFHRDEEYMLVDEESPDIDDAAVEFSLAEFSGGRSFLHWTSENGSVHWRDINKEDSEIARLQESVAWWIPPQGFGCALTPGGLDEKDYLAVFTVRRGEWDDRLFDKLSRGPGEDGRELDWPYPEMVGSTVSMITAHTDKSGDAYFKWKLFDGSRKWGFLASSFAENDGSWKEISAVQHKNSSPRLQDFKDWQLDHNDELERPYVLLRRDNLPALKKKRNDPKFARIWKQVKGSMRGGYGVNTELGLCGIIEGDPLTLWRVKKIVFGVAHIRARMTLLGRDYSDMYCPVGARPITQWAELYDLAVGTGVFTPEEERISRAFLMLMGHMYMEEDLMNWRYNSRNANFEADRVDVVGAVGLTFYGCDDAKEMVQHGADLMKRSLVTYCTPGSGKWYENPACYYLHASSCRLNLAWHLYSHDIIDSTEVERLKDYLSWGPNILTPRFPHDNKLLTIGCSDEEYSDAEKVRRVPPVGDHAHLGQWVGEYFALMGKAYEDRDPEFANYLKWAYCEGGREGGHFNKYAMYFVEANEDDITDPAPVTLPSRRLEGFGSVFRGNFGEPDEFYLLLKLGPGGYRYHRTEGSFIMFADGKPLIYDGGEAGETWRHSTLSFGDTHMPLAAGHVERFHSFENLDFTQGVNPKALTPGEPVFLSDICDHDLVDEAYRRYAEPNPANSRSCLWVKDEYVVVHDQLNLPDDALTHWHMQVVADDHEFIAENNYRFKGRFGTDLQIILPDQNFAAEEIVQTPIVEYHLKPEDTFAMRHLQLSSTSPKSVGAVLRPLSKGKTQLSAEFNGSNIRVSGDGIDDIHFIDRDGISVNQNGCEFNGLYASVLKRTDSLTLAMIDGQKLSSEGITLNSSGASIVLTKNDEGISVCIEGQGEVSVDGLDKPLSVNVTKAEGQILIKL